MAAASELGSGDAIAALPTQKRLHAIHRTQQAQYYPKTKNMMKELLEKWSPWRDELTKLLHLYGPDCNAPVPHLCLAGHNNQDLKTLLLVDVMHLIGRPVVVVDAKDAMNSAQLIRQIGSRLCLHELQRVNAAQRGKPSASSTLANRELKSPFLRNFAERVDFLKRARGSSGGDPRKLLLLRRLERSVGSYRLTARKRSSSHLIAKHSLNSHETLALDDCSHVDTYLGVESSSVQNELLPSTPHALGRVLDRTFGSGEAATIVVAGADRLDRLQRDLSQKLLDVCDSTAGALQLVFETQSAGRLHSSLPRCSLSLIPLRFSRLSSKDCAAMLVTMKRELHVLAPQVIDYVSNVQHFRF